MVLASSREHTGDGALEHDPAREVVWHDLECGRYRADLALWRELAESSRRGTADAPESHAGAWNREHDREDAAILDVGAGTGRVAFDLARAGHRVTALERDPALLAELQRRAQGTTVSALGGDARTMQLPRNDFALCIVPMQTVQLLGGPDARGAFLGRVRAHLRPGGLLACAIVCDLEPFDCAAGDVGPKPEMTRVDATLYISRPTGVRVRRRVVRIERERVLVPAGHSVESKHTRREADVVELDRVTPDALEDEGRAAGFSPLPTRAIAPTRDHVGSTVVILRA
jgi:SAM-dependent methyltransferase